MVSVKNQHRRLSSFFQLRYQICNKQIRLIQMVHIILPGIGQSFIFNSLNGDSRIFNHLFLWIISMALYRNGKHEILLLCRIHGIQYVLCQHIILCPAILCILQNVHKFLAGITVKSHVVKYICTTVEITTIIMKGVCAIPKLLQGSSNTLCLLLLHNGLIWIFSRSKITKIHPCQDFELRICSTGSNRRHFKIARRIIVHQRTEGRNRILGCGEKLHLIGIKERLQLNQDDVWHLFIGCGGLRQCLILIQRCNTLFAITTRLCNPCIEQTCAKAIRQTIILICKSNISKIVGYNTLLNCQIRKRNNRSDSQRCNNQCRKWTYLSLEFPCMSPHIHQPENSQQNSCNNQYTLHTGKIFIQHGNSIVDHFQILSIKWCYTHAQHITVYNSDNQPKHTDNGSCKYSSFENIYNKKSCKNHICIKQKSPRRK